MYLAVSVLLQSRVPPNTFRLMRSKFDLTPLVTLANAGVRVGLYVGDEDNGRNLRWEVNVGWHHPSFLHACSLTLMVVVCCLIQIGRAVDAGLSMSNAVRAVTANVADMFNIPGKQRM